MELMDLAAKERVALVALLEWLAEAWGASVQFEPGTTRD